MKYRPVLSISFMYFINTLKFIKNTIQLKYLIVIKSKPTKFES